MMERGGLDERVTERKKEKEAETKEESWGGKRFGYFVPHKDSLCHGDIALYWPLL